MVKAVFQLPNTKRVAGPSGTIARVEVKRFGVDYDMFVDSIGLPDYCPNSMIVSVRNLPFPRYAVCILTACCSTARKTCKKFTVTSATGPVPCYMTDAASSWQ